MDFCQGITLHHLPGHTDGLVGMQINMPETGTFFFISDHCHVIENVRLTDPHSLACNARYSRAYAEYSGVMVSLKAGWLGTILLGSGVPSASRDWNGLRGDR